jgi:hypothetical protein
MIVDEFLRRLEAGRAAVLRQAREYLRRSGAKRIAEAYRRAYRGRKGLDAEFAGWEHEGAWPEK